MRIDARKSRNKCALARLSVPLPIRCINECFYAVKVFIFTQLFIAILKKKKFFLFVLIFSQFVSCLWQRQRQVHCPIRLTLLHLWPALTY